MTSKRLHGPAVLGSLMLLCAARPAVAAPEPLVVTPMADPDPNFVPPPPEPRKARRAQRQSDEHPTLDQAMENLGQVTGQLAKMGEQYPKSNPNWEAEAREYVRKMREQAGAPRN